MRWQIFNKAYISLGSNISDGLEVLHNAYDELSRISKNSEISSIYLTKPVGFVEQPQFTNAVCKLHVDFDPFQLLKHLMGLQNNLGRNNSFPNGPRILDLDLISYSDLVIDTPLLKLPHPRMENRLFVIIPLMELDPVWVNPVSKRSITNLFETASTKGDSSEITKVFVRK